MEYNYLGKSSLKVSPLCLGTMMFGDRTDMQEAEIGEALDIGKSLPALRRGDLLFWKGHAGIMRDGEILLHANAHHMAVASEEVVQTIARLEKAGLPVTAVKRLV